MINAFLDTGRAILALERQLVGMPYTDPRRRRLAAEHSRLMRRQQKEIVAAHRAGVDWDTITFALVLHGQSADREVGDTDPTPAEQLLALMREHGGLAVVDALDTGRNAITSADAADSYAEPDVRSAGRR